MLKTGGQSQLLQTKTADRQSKPFNAKGYDPDEQTSKPTIEKTRKARAFITTHLWIPEKYVPKALAQRYYEQQIFDEKTCVKCDNFQYRFNATCEGCEAFLGSVKLWKYAVSKSGKGYFGFPLGNLTRVARLLNLDLTIDDRRPVIKMRSPLKFTSKLWTGKVVEGRQTPDQKKLIDIWLEKKYGIIRARPRTGKTVIAVYCICEVGKRTIIVAHQADLLRQFLREFKEKTNLLTLRKKTGRKIVGIVKNIKDIRKLDVALVTYQKFIRDSGPARLKKYVKDQFTVMVVDEVHQAAATEYAKVCGKINAKYRMGLTATPARKDCRHTIARDVIGPVIAKSDTNAMVPAIQLRETGIAPPRQINHWTYAMKFLFTNEIRNKMLVRDAFMDLRAGHKAIIIPTDHIKHIHTLVEMLNRQARINRIKRKEDWPKEIAVAFHGKSNRKQILRDFENGKFKIMVAMRSMVKQGLTMTLPSMLYVQAPMSAAQQPIGAPFFYQLSNRVSTFYKGKEQPVVRIWVDNIGQSTGCFRSLFFNEILPNLRRKESNDPQYKMDGSIFERSMELAKSTRNYRAEPGVWKGDKEDEERTETKIKKRKALPYKTLSDD